MVVERFKNVTGHHGFDYAYENRDIAPGQTLILSRPPITANKRGVNDYGWISSDDITLYGTLAEDAEDLPDEFWQIIKPHDVINKTTRYIKIVNTSPGKKGWVFVTVILN